MSKADYVRGQRQWGCKPHWYALPKNLRDRIWATYEPGQEVSMTPSAAYLEAAHAVQDWITQHEACKPQGKLL